MSAGTGPLQSGNTHGGEIDLCKKTEDSLTVGGGDVGFDWFR